MCKRNTKRVLFVSLFLLFFSNVFPWSYKGSNVSALVPHGSRSSLRSFPRSRLRREVPKATKLSTGDRAKFRTRFDLRDV